MRSNRKQPQDGFTLIELLVVIAIVSVLAAFLFPIVASSREKSNQTISLSNLKQWGVALTRSISDNNGFMPSDGQGFTSINRNDTDAWFNRLPPYIEEKPLSDGYYDTNPPTPGNRSVWVNPAVPKVDAVMKYIQPPQKFLFCYSMNYFLSNSKEHTQPISRIEYPSATVFMAEKNDDYAVCNPTKIRAYFGPGNPLTDQNNAANFLFCDGHVELIKRSVFDPNFAPDTEDNPSPTNNTNLNQHFTFIPYRGASS